MGRRLRPGPRGRRGAMPILRICSLSASRPSPPARRICGGAGVKITYVLRGGVLVEKRLAARAEAAVSGRAPMIRPDGMDPIRSQLDGRIYDSRSAYYASLRAGGAEIVGNDRAAFERRPDCRPAGVAQSLKQAIEQLESR